jgi:hypothetical protein
VGMSAGDIVILVVCVTGAALSVVYLVAGYVDSRR